MDQFVQGQLKQIGLEYLIPLFRDKGYNEDSYRQLTMRKLLQLFPEETDEAVVRKILDNVNPLNDPAAANATGIFSSANGLAKTEPAELTPGTSDDDEVQITDVITRAPSGFTHTEVKQEEIEGTRPEEADSSDNLESHNQQPVIVEQVNATSVAAIESLDRAGGIPTPTQDNANGVSGNNNYSNDEVTPNGEGAPRWSGLSRKRMSHFTEQRQESQPGLKIRKICMSNVSKWAQIQSALARNPTEVKKHFREKLELVCESSTDLNNVLELLEAHSAQLQGIVKWLQFVLIATGTEHKISNTQISRMANLPEIFLGHLTTLVFSVEFTETTDFNVITTMLAKCRNLKNFAIEHGVVLTSTERTKCLQVPKMDKLVKFEYANQIAAWVPDFDNKSPSINIKNRTANIRFEINFGSHEYPALETLCLGPLTNLSFKCSAQFPKLRTFDFGDVGVYHGLLATIDDRAFDKIRNITLPNIGQDLIHHVDCTFPNLQRLVLNLPTFATLSSIIQALHPMHIEEIIMLVGYEFESALLNALRGRPFKLVTEGDKRKVAEMQKYAHWKEFMEYLEIEVPNEELNANSSSTALLENVKLEHSEDAYICHEQVPTISWFKDLKRLEFRYVNRVVYLPENNQHWTSPDVQLSEDQWSTKKQRFPGSVLVELTKLKGKLTLLRLVDFEVDPNAARQFQKKMGFKIELEEGQEPDKSLDSFTGYQLASRGIKREVE